MGFGNIDTGGNSFFMRAWDSTNNTANAYRPFSTTLTTGQSFSAVFAIAYRGGKKGFNLWQDTGSTNFLVNFEVRNDENNYYWDSTGTGWGYSQTTIVTLSAYKQDANTMRISVSNGGTPVVVTKTGTNITVGSLQVYVDKTCCSDNLQGICFNSMRIY